MEEQKGRIQDKEQEAPKCDLWWEDGHYVLECETPEDRDRATKALEEEEVIVKVKVKKEGQEAK